MVVLRIRARAFGVYILWPPDFWKLPLVHCHLKSFSPSLVIQGLWGEMSRAKRMYGGLSMLHVPGRPVVCDYGLLWVLLNECPCHKIPTV